ncbi:MAG TPA: glycosyltransferase family 9 protein, partial [Verrucomicrobiae bacterium]
MRRFLHQFGNALIRCGRAAILMVFDSVVLWTARRSPAVPAGAIFALHGLGDLILAGHAIQTLSRHLQQRGLKVSLYVNPAWVEFARDYFPVDQVAAIDRHRFSRQLRYRTQVLRELAGRYEVAHQPTYNRMLRVEDCLIRATRAHERIGSAGHAMFISPLEQWVGNRFYTRIIPCAPGPQHELLRYAEYLAALKLAATAGPWLLTPGPVQGHHLTPPLSPYLVLAPGSSDRRRTWPLARFVRVAHHLAAQHGLQIVLIRDRDPGEPITWEPELAPPDFLDLTGRLATHELPTWLGQARMILCNDSGLYHLGVSLQRPTLGVGGSGLPDRYFPYPAPWDNPSRILFKPVPCAGCNWRCIYPLTRQQPAWCLDQVSWLQVL